MIFLSTKQVREVDRQAIEEYGVPSIVLMENAGRGSAELLLRLGVHGRGVICCGKGNNGGDGLVIARHLDNFRVDVKVILFGDPGELSGDASINFKIIDKAGLPITVIKKEDINQEAIRQELAGAEWIIDALFGTGLSGPVKSPYDTIIDTINAANASVLAVDIPSGLDGDTGKPLGATIRANHTATFVAAKEGFANPDSEAWTGSVHVVSIGAPCEYRFLPDDG